MLAGLRLYSHGTEFRRIARRQLKPSLELEIKRGMAWSVHAFTTSGIVLGFLALVAVLKNDVVLAFLWLGMALFVDGVDGTLARRARVKEHTPNFDGAALDLVIDFFTYVAVPALMIYWFNMVQVPWLFSGQTWSLICAALIMAVSCYTFANVNMKSFDYYFVGFPAIWNVVVLYFYLFNTGWLINFITIIALSILTFVPIKFVHPLRVVYWRNTTIAMTVLWAAMTISLVVDSLKPNPADWVHTLELALFGIATAYFVGISLWRTFVVGRKGEIENEKESVTAA